MASQMLVAIHPRKSTVAVDHITQVEYHSMFFSSLIRLPQNYYNRIAARSIVFLFIAILLGRLHKFCFFFLHSNRLQSTKRSSSTGIRNDLIVMVGRPNRDLFKYLTQRRINDNYRLPIRDVVNSHDGVSSNFF